MENSEYFTIDFLQLPFIMININVSRKGKGMTEILDKEAIVDTKAVREFLEEIGEDPSEYTEEQLESMIEKGF